MTTALVALAGVAGGVGMFFGLRALWRHLGSRLWKPPGAWQAVIVATRGLGIDPPLVYWIRGEWFVDSWGRKVVSLWVPGRLTVAKGDAQLYSATGLPFELAREAIYQRTGKIEVSDPQSVGGTGVAPELDRIAAVARAALEAAGL